MAPSYPLCAFLAAIDKKTKTETVAFMEVQTEII
jgi:hypothetical protein